MQKSKGSWTAIGVATAIASLCLGLVYPWWQSTGYHLIWEWGKQTDESVTVSTEVSQTYTHENSGKNFQNILKF